MIDFIRSMCCNIFIFILAFYTDLLLLSWFLFIRSYYIRTDDLYLERSYVENVLFDTRIFSCFGCMMDCKVMLGYVLYPAVAIANTNQTEAVRQEDYLNMNFDYLLDPKGAYTYPPRVFEFLVTNRTARRNITRLEIKYMDDYMQLLMDDDTMQDREEVRVREPPTLAERMGKVRQNATLDERTTSYLFHRSSLTKSDMNKILDAEFNPYMDRFDFQLNWFFRLFLTNKGDDQMKIACICVNNFCDIEDDFDTSFISHDFPKRDCRRFALYLDDVKKKLTRETKSGRVKLYLKNALWCDNKLTSDYPIRRLNEYLIQRLVRQLRYLITMESKMFFERYRRWRLLQIMRKSFLEDKTTQLPAVTEKLTDE